MTHLAFNEKFYLARNPDVAAAVKEGLLTAAYHFESHGIHEGRSPNPLFNTKYYLEQNQDVAAAVEAGVINAYTHFVHYGSGEGRSSTPLFDEAFYLSLNTDVADAVKAGHMTAIQHFLQFGQNEGRVILPSINLASYMAANKDIADAAKAGTINVFEHLLSYGITEGRDLGNGVNLADFANDTKFIKAVVSGDIEAAIGRVEAVAPFMPDFERPAGWKPDANTPIPVDFVPLEGKHLIVPEDINIPKGMVLPDFIKPVNPVNPFDVEVAKASVTIDGTKVEKDVVKFVGDADGAISMTLDSTGKAVFSRGEHKVEVESISGKVIDTTDVALRTTPTDLDLLKSAVYVHGAGTFTVSGSVTFAQYAKIAVTGERTTAFKDKPNDVLNFHLEDTVAAFETALAGSAGNLFLGAQTVTVNGVMSSTLANDLIAKFGLSSSVPRSITNAVDTNAAAFTLQKYDGIAYQVQGGNGDTVFTGASSILNQLTLDGGAGTDVLVVNHAGDAAQNLSLYNVTNVESLTLNNTGTSVLTVTTANSAVESVSITGSGDVVLNVQGVNLATVDASALTGQAEINLTAKAAGVMVVSGQGDDLILGGQGDDIYVLAVDGVETGADTIVFNTANGGADTVHSFFAAGQVLDPEDEAGVDVLHFNNLADIDALVADLASITFTDRSEENPDAAVDVTLLFSSGASVTLADFVAVEADLSGLSTEGTFSGDIEDDLIIHAGEVITLTGATADDLIGFLGEGSFAFGSIT